MKLQAYFSCSSFVQHTKSYSDDSDVSFSQTFLGQQAADSYCKTPKLPVSYSEAFSCVSLGMSPLFLERSHLRIKSSLNDIKTQVHKAQFRGQSRRTSPEYLT